MVEAGVQSRPSEGARIAQEEWVGKGLPAPSSRLRTQCRKTRGKQVHQVFGDELNTMIDELNGVLAA